MSRTRTINDAGIGYAGIGQELLKDFWVYDEGSSVQLRVEVYERGKEFGVRSHEAMQYLSPEDAMRIAKAFERCAIRALKSLAE